MPDFFFPVLFVLLTFPALLSLYYGVRYALLGPKVQLHSVALAQERELRLAQMRARRLRTARYQDEHSSWDEEFRALGGGCSCHGGPRRPRLRESPPVARW